MIAGITASTRRGGSSPEQYVPLIVEASGAFTVQANREVELLFSWDNLNWSQVTVLGYTEVSPPPHGETLCYIREADTSNTEGITFPSQQSTNGRNFHGVVQWWDSPTPIKLNLGWKDFYVPQESPENMTDMSGMFRASYVFNQDISGWDVSKAENMDRMFMTALEFNQDLSGWCVSQFPQEPFDFSRETDSWSLPKPVWGTCPSTDLPSVIGQAFGGGFYAGDIEYPDGQWYKLIVADVSADITGANSRWKTSGSSTPNTHHVTDGVANTSAMVAADIELHPAASHCIEHRGGDNADWYMPAKDELNVIYQNLSPYHPNPPEHFQLGGEQAFSTSSYRASTEHSPTNGWIQYLGSGDASGTHKDDPGRRVRPVRRLPFTP